MDDEILMEKLNKQKVIETFKTAYPKMNEYIIEQFYDFCVNPEYKDYNDYLFLSLQKQDRELEVPELSRWKKLNKQYKKILEQTPMTTPLEKLKETNMEIKGAVTFTEP